LSHDVRSTGLNDNYYNYEDYNFNPGNKDEKKAPATTTTATTATTTAVVKKDEKEESLSK
jgi:hypothetical protein